MKVIRKVRERVRSQWIMKERGRVERSERERERMK